MSASTSHSEENGRIEKGPAGELKKTISTKTQSKSSDASTSRKDDDKITFRGPDGGPKTYSKEELKKLQVHIEIKKPKAEKPPPNVPFDPNFIVPVRRPGVKKTTTKSDGEYPGRNHWQVNKVWSFEESKNYVPITLGKHDDQDVISLAKGRSLSSPGYQLSMMTVRASEYYNTKKEKSSDEKKKEKSEHGKPHSSRLRLASKSRSPGSSSRRSDRRYKDYISEREEYIRRRKEAYLRERERYRREHQRPRSRHHSRSRSRSSSSAGSSSSDNERRSRSISSSPSKSRTSHKSEKKSRSRSRGRRRSASSSRSRTRDSRRKDRSRERESFRRQGPGPSNMQGMVPYPMNPGPQWVSRPPFRNPFLPGPPIPFYPGPMLYPAPHPFRPFPPPFRGVPRFRGRRP